MTKKRFIIINEQHSLLPDQERALGEHWSSGYETEIIKVPPEGWTYEKMIKIAGKISSGANDKKIDSPPWPDVVVIFVSPVPALMLLLARLHRYLSLEALTFHNDKRVAKEVPDGKGGVKLIHTVAPDGWMIV